MAPLHLGEAGRGSAGARRAASAASEIRAAAPGVPPGAAPGMLEPEEGGDLRREPQPRRGGRQPAAKEGRATALPRVATESRGGREQAKPPLVEEPPREGEGCSTGGAARRVRAQQGHTPGQEKSLEGRLHAEKRPTFEPPAHGWERKEPGRHGGGRCCRRRRRGKTRRTEGPAV